MDSLPEGIKWCGKCKETKSRECFSRNKSRPDGRQDHCKICRAAHHRNSYIPREKSSKRKKPELNSFVRYKNLKTTPTICDGYALLPLNGKKAQGRFTKVR